MKNNIIAIAAMLIMLVVAQGAYAQESRKELYNYSIGFQPLYLANGGLRVDFEKRLSDKRLLQVGAIGYLLPDREYDYWDTLLLDSHRDIRKMTGAGLALDHKWFPFQKANFLYFSVGASYNYYNVKYNGLDYTSYEEDGLRYYEPYYGKITQDIHKVGGNACFGIQSSVRKPFVVDGYVGWGYSHSFYDDEKAHINRHFMTAGYSGMTFLLGLRLGWRFGR